MSRVNQRIPQSVDVELFISPYCTHCAAVRKTLQAMLSGLPGATVRYQERNVLEHLERAVALGVTGTPALAIGGRLIAIRSWRANRFRQTLLEHLENRGQ